MRVLAADWWGPDGKALKHTFLKSRRIGGSEVATMRALTFALGRRLIHAPGTDEDGDYIPETPMPGIVVSKDYHGSKDLVAKLVANVREWADAGDPDCIAALPHCHETKIYFPTTGTKIEAIACSPTSIRGSTGFVILDEFAFARSQEEVWGAAKSITDPNLGFPRGYPILVVTTPWDSGSFAYRLFTDPSFPFSENRFSVDIYQAVADGFPIDPRVAFAELGIPELVDTEYLCKWSRGGYSFFALDKLRDCLVDQDEEGLSDDDENVLSGLPIGFERAPCRVGIDCGGGVGRDFTAAVMWRLINSRWWMTGIKASNSTGTEEMADRVGEWLLDKSIVDDTVQIDVRCDRGVMGADFIKRLQKKVKDRQRTNVIGVGMSGLEQESYALSGRKLLERDQMVIYQGTDAGGEDERNSDNGAHAFMLELSRIKARRGQGGHLAFTTPRDPLQGHCDRAWAGLIGLEGADLGIGIPLTNEQRAKLYPGDDDSPWGNQSDSRGFG